MAGDNINIQVEDDAVVTVDLSADAELANLVGEEGVEPTPSLKETKGAVTGTQEATPPADKRTRKSAAADEAAAALSSALQKADEERRAREAADATALAERQRADAATRLAAQSSEEARAAREEASQRGLESIVRDIEATTTEIANLEGEIVRAKEAGDFAKETSAQSKLARAAAKLDRREADKAAFEDRLTRQQTAAETVVQPQVNQSAFEHYVSQTNFAPAAQSWLRAHPDCVPPAAGGDPTKNAKMMAGHYAAVAANIPVNSPDYFRTIEEHVGIRQPTSSASETTPAAQQQRRTPVPAAPVSRDPPASDGRTAQHNVSLNPQQQEVALFSYPAKPGEDESSWRKRAFGTYATELLRATAEGKIGRLTH